MLPDHKTIADFRKDNGRAIRQVCARFVALCRMMGLLTQASVAIDGSKFKAVNNRDKNFKRAKMERRMAQMLSDQSAGFWPALSHLFKSARPHRGAVSSSTTA